MRNDEGTAGQEGSGLKITGIRMTIVTKGSAIPGEKAAVQGIDPNRPMIALTFDDGPHAPVTNRILDSLEANGGRATFFMVGNRVTGKANKAAVARMAANWEQRELSHSWHEPMTAYVWQAVYPLCLCGRRAERRATQR